MIEIDPVTMFTDWGHQAAAEHKHGELLAKLREDWRTWKSINRVFTKATWDMSVGPRPLGLSSRETVLAYVHTITAIYMAHVDDHEQLTTRMRLVATVLEYQLSHVSRRPFKSHQASPMFEMEFGFIRKEARTHGHFVPRR